MKDYNCKEFSEIQFASNEKEDLKFLLRRYSSDKVDEFIRLLEIACAIKVYRNNYTPYIDIKDIRMKLKKDLLVAYASIDKLMLKDNALQEYSAMIRIANESNHVPNEILINYDIMKIAQQLQINIQDFVSKMDDIVKYTSYSVKPGRKSCNKDKFYSEIGVLYATYFEMPTYRKNCVFAELIACVNEYMGLKDSDPHRAIRQAIKDVRNGYSSSFLLPTIFQR